MKVVQYSLLALSLARSCLAEVSEVSVVHRVYWYAMYDFDVHIWGPGNGYVAADCNTERKCTFNEFINFIEFGEASEEPSYYDLDAEFQISPGLLAGMIIATRQIVQAWETRYDRIIPERLSAVGLWIDFGKVIDSNYKEMDRQNIGATRHLTNLKTIASAAYDFHTSWRDPKLLQHMSNRITNVVWEVKQIESNYRNGPWNKLDWQQTVASYPDLANSDSQLYKDVVRELRNFQTNTDVDYHTTSSKLIAHTYMSCHGRV